MLSTASLKRWSGIVGLMLVLCLVITKYRTQIFEFVSDTNNVSECTCDKTTPNRQNGIDERKLMELIERMETKNLISYQKIEDRVQQLVALERSQHDKFKQMDANIKSVQNAVQSIDNKMESFLTENKGESQENTQAEAVIEEKDDGLDAKSASFDLDKFPIKDLDKFGQKFDGDDKEFRWPTLADLKKLKLTQPPKLKEIVTVLPDDNYKSLVSIQLKFEGGMESPIFGADDS